MDTTTDLKAHLDRLHAGDAAALDALIARAYGRLERLARKMLGDFRRLRSWEDTGDVLHDAYPRLRAALAGTEVATVQAFFRLAGTALRRQLIDLHRHHFGPEGSAANRRPQPEASASGASGSEPSDLTAEPGRLAAWAEFHRQVEALPEEEREAFDLLWYQELTQEEAAAVAGVSLATLKRRWMAARLRLQAVLRETE